MQRGWGVIVTRQVLSCARSVATATRSMRPGRHATLSSQCRPPAQRRAPGIVRQNALENCCRPGLHHHHAPDAAQGMRSMRSMEGHVIAFNLPPKSLLVGCTVSASKGASAAAADRCSRGRERSRQIGGLGLNTAHGSRILAGRRNRAPSSCRCRLDVVRATLAFVTSQLRCCAPRGRRKGPIQARSKN
jgi:hypothetical protein